MAGVAGQYETACTERHGPLPPRRVPGRAADAGATTIIVARGEEELLKARDAMKKAGGKVFAYTADAAPAPGSGALAVWMNQFKFLIGKKENRLCCAHAARGACRMTTRGG